jgi:hypothetical protein
MNTKLVEEFIVLTLTIKSGSKRKKIIYPRSPLQVFFVP